MNYSKPEIVVLGAAAEVIQGKQNSTVIDNDLTVPAYDLDE